jgi:DNA-binding PadR family transcriptional regulator
MITGMSNDDDNHRGNAGSTGVIIPDVPDYDDMTQEDRRRLVLEFLSEHPLALPPKVIHRNLKLHRSITFQYQTVNSYLDTLTKEGYVRRVDPSELDNLPTALVDLESGPNKPSYYIITEEGRAYLNER